MSHRSRFALVSLLAALVVVPAAFAQGGNGGGGGGGGGGTGGGGGGGGGSTLKYGAINNVSAAATCDAGTSIGVGLSKSTNNQILGTISMVGGTNADGTSTLYGSWSILLHNDTLDTSVGGVVGNAFGPTVPSVLIKNLFGGVPAGSYDLTMTFVKHPYAPSWDPTAPVVETCAAHFSVFAK
jgi:hypothetical protein